MYSCQSSAIQRICAGQYYSLAFDLRTRVHLLSCAVFFFFVLFCVCVYVCVCVPVLTPAENNEEKPTHEPFSHHMQLSREPSSSSSYNRAVGVGRQDNARRKKSCVTFPPINATQDERRGSSTPACAAVGKRWSPQQSIPSLWHYSSAMDSSPADSAANVPLSAVVAAECGACKATPPMSTAPLQAANRNATRRCSRPLYGASRDSLSARNSARGKQSRALSSEPVFQHVVTEVEQDEKQANALLCDGKVGDALSVLEKALCTAQEYAAPSHTQKAGKGSAVPQPTATTTGAPSTPAATLRSASSLVSTASLQTATAAAASLAELSKRLAVMHTVVACSAGVRCGVTAEPLSLQEAYFQAAMRYLVKSEEENLFPEWKRSSQSTLPTSAAMTTSKPSKRSASFCLADGKEPNGIRSRLLRCAVRNNAAVCLADRSSRGGQARTVYELLKALIDARGVWGAAVLYNLAVAFLAVEHYDDATEAIARCMELSYYYLQLAEKAQRDPLWTPSEAVSAIYAAMALQLIRGHHFIAAMAAWCDPAGALEVQHCEMALGCAKQYLSPADAKQRECRRRLAAAHARAAGSSSAAAAAAPLLLPFVTQDFLSSGGASSTEGCTTPAGGGAIAAGVTDVNALVEGLLSLSSTTSSTLAADLPTEVGAYVLAAEKGDALRFWVKEAQLHGAAPPFLSAAKALAPLPASLLSSSPAAVAADAGEDSTRKPSRLSSSSVRPQHSNNGSHTTSEVNDLPVVLRPSKPTPCFVTTLPQSTFQRYRGLRASVVTQLESEEVEPASALLVSDNSDEDHCPRCGRSSGDGSVAAVAAATAAHDVPFACSSSGRGRRMTALLYGATAHDASLVETQKTGSHDDNHPPYLDGDAESDESVVAEIRPEEALSSMLAVPVRPSELLRQLDSETEACYSRLLADPLADMRRQAAARLQSWWRVRTATRERERRGAAVALRCREEAQAYRIQCVFRVWRRRKQQRAQREKVHEARCREERVSVIQAFLRYRQSLELWGRACVARYKQLVLQRLNDQRVSAAAVKLQSWWRMCAAQAAIRAVVRAVLRLQAVWRGACARLELRRLRVHRQLEEAAYQQRRLPQVLTVQQWWRSSRERRAARRCVAEKQRAIAAYLAEAETAYDDAIRAGLRHPGDSDDAVAAMRTVLAVLAGAHDRRKLAAVHHYSQIRQRAVHRHILSRRGFEERQRLRRDRDDALRVQRRREEVAVATLRLQRWTRQWLPRQRLRRGTRAADEWSRAATKIQAVWRMHQNRQQSKAFLQFMTTGRHQYAAVIQRAWRAYRQRSTAAPVGPQRAMESEGEMREGDVTR